MYVAKDSFESMLAGAAHDGPPCAVPDRAALFVEAGASSVHPAHSGHGWEGSAST